MSTLKADTLVASDGTSPVTLTKQEAAKHYIGYDHNSSVTIFSSFNNSSFTDNGRGEATLAYTNNFANDDYIYVASCLGGSNADTAITGTSYRASGASAETNPPAKYATDGISTKTMYVAPTVSDEFDPKLSTSIIHGDLA